MIDVTKISSKGQVVIPKPIRDSLDLMEGDRLIAYARGDLIIFKRLNGGESILSLLSPPLREKAEELGITRKDVEDAVEWAKEHPLGSPRHQRTRLSLVLGGKRVKNHGISGGRPNPRIQLKTTNR